MVKMTNELKEKILTARSGEEAAELLREDGMDAQLAERLWTELMHKREADGSELSLDEMESISGGADRNWVTEGCASTMEYGSWCGSNDRCIVWDVTYEYEPTGNLCPNCGKNMYRQNTISLGGDKYEDQYRCKYCGCITSKTYYVISDLR